jgi:hypothetical protein
MHEPIGTLTPDRARELVEFFHYLHNECGYRHLKPIDDGQWAAIGQFMSTYAILVGPLLDRVSITRRWCYHSPLTAREALEAWDGRRGTEPEGWHRDPMTGRRRIENPETGAIEETHRW